MDWDVISRDLQADIMDKWRDGKKVIVAYDAKTMLNEEFNIVSKKLQKLKSYGVEMIALTSESDVNKVKQQLKKQKIPVDDITNHRFEYDVYLDQKSGIRESYELLCSLIYSMKAKLKLDMWQIKWKEHIERHRLKLILEEEINYHFLSKLTIKNVSVLGSATMKIATLRMTNGKGIYEIKPVGKIVYNGNGRIFNIDGYKIKKTDGLEYEKITIEGEVLFNVFEKFPWDELGNFYEE